MEQLFAVEIVGQSRPDAEPLRAFRFSHERHARGIRHAQDESLQEVQEDDGPESEDAQPQWARQGR